MAIEHAAGNGLCLWQGMDLSGVREAHSGWGKVPASATCLLSLLLEGKSQLGMA